MNIKIYILCYNHKTEEIANQSFGSYEWAKVINIKSTKILENIMYEEWLLNNIDDWKNCDYVGTLSWKSLQKIKLPDIDQLKKDLILTNPDFFAFLVGKQSLIKRTNLYHPLFGMIWTKLLKNMGYDEKFILSEKIIPFYSNYWICKSEIMLKYITFFNKCKKILDNDEELIRLMNMNSLYKGNLDHSDCLKIFDKPYYTYHPFIFERLPCFFVFINNLKIKYDIKSSLINI